jgi:hypothetical protein
MFKALAAFTLAALFAAGVYAVGQKPQGTPKGVVNQAPGQPLVLPGTNIPVPAAVTLTISGNPGLNGQGVLPYEFIGSGRWTGFVTTTNGQQARWVLGYVGQSTALPPLIPNSIWALNLYSNGVNGSSGGSLYYFPITRGVSPLTSTGVGQLIDGSTFNFTVQ